PPAPASAADYAEILEDPQRILEECGDEIYRAFQQLSTAQRSCILLREVEQFSYKDIAEILEIPLGTVMTHLARGRRKLREQLTAYARERGIVGRLVKLQAKSRASGDA